jgi:hypothetical protein
MGLKDAELSVRMADTHQTAVGVLAAHLSDAGPSVLVVQPVDMGLGLLVH